MHIAHITIHSAKKEESVAFFEKFCGLKIQRIVGDGITFLADSEGATNIEIIPDPEHAADVNNLSIGFVVENAADYRDQLIKEGLEVSPLVSPNPSVQFFFVKDPNEVQIQFVENK